MKNTKLFFDGLCEPFNPGGHGGWGAVIKFPDGQIITLNGYLGTGPDITNNVAEYTALIQGLKKLQELGITQDVKVFGDSQLAINQMTGWYEVHSRRIYPLWEEAQELAASFQNISFNWIPREKNQEADRQSRLGLYWMDSEQKKARIILDTYTIVQNEDGSFSLTKPDGTTWTVEKMQDRLYRCNCPAYRRNKKTMLCKHTVAVHLMQHKGQE